MTLYLPQILLVNLPVALEMSKTTCDWGGTSVERRFLFQELCLWVFSLSLLSCCFSSNVKQNPGNLHMQLFKLEDLRKQRLEDLATLIGKIYRGWKCRTHFLLMKKCQVVIASWYRRYSVRYHPYYRGGSLHCLMHVTFMGCFSLMCTESCWKNSILC